MTVVKIIRIVGNSPVSWAKAAAAAVQEASKTVRNIQGVEATDFTAKVDANGRIKEYRCTVNIAFLVGGGAAEGKGARGRR
ncbi:MAG TPA: dodecin family protein [Gemmatimonadota bacterium]|jgi:flavin-binding protein dodecin